MDYFVFNEKCKKLYLFRSYNPNPYEDTLSLTEIKRFIWQLLAEVSIYNQKYTLEKEVTFMFGTPYSTVRNKRDFMVSIFIKENNQYFYKKNFAKDEYSYKFSKNIEKIDDLILFIKNIDNMKMQKEDKIRWRIYNSGNPRFLKIDKNTN